MLDHRQECADERKGPQAISKLYPKQTLPPTVTCNEVE